MARVIYGTANITSTGGVAQFSTDSIGRVMVATFHARGTNAGQVYLGSDSNVSSAAGWELSANEEKVWRYRDFQAGSAIKPIAHWMAATDTSQKVDWEMILEN